MRKDIKLLVSVILLNSLSSFVNSSVTVELLSKPENTEAFFNTKSKIKVEVCRDSGIMYLTSQKEKSINLQLSLLNYMKAKQGLHNHNLFQLKEVLKEPKVDEKNKIILTVPRSILFNLDEITYTDDDIELLEEGKLIKVKGVPPVKYTNKKYVEDWNERHPESLKEVESKIINPIIICKIERASDQEKVELAINLGADVSILLDGKYRIEITGMYITR